MNSEIHWINHAGYELRTGGLRIVHDPWLFGLAFDNGWALLSESTFKPTDFAGVDYIWFSHEHPDHFSPAVIKSIPEDIRATITVLFQKTKDQRVVNFCRKAGFRVQELEDGVRTPLSDRVAVTCGQVIGRDSWLYVESDDVTIFNANDCVGVDWTDIAARLPRPLDVLLTQFSFANWVGNPGEIDRMNAAAAQKYVEIDRQIEIFRPKSLIPFASYIWFCQPENFHMNAHANRIGDVAARFQKKLPVVVLYPGDRYIVGQPHDNRSAIERYTRDMDAIKAPMAIAESSFATEELIALSNKEQQRLKSVNSLWVMRPLAWLGFLKTVRLYCDDIGEGFSYSMFGGILATGLPRESCELVTRSASFATMIKTGYGFGTLAINGRYLEIVDGAMARLSRHFAVAARNEEAEFVPGMFLRPQYVFHQLKLKLLPRRTA